MRFLSQRRNVSFSGCKFQTFSYETFDEQKIEKLRKSRWYGKAFFELKEKNDKPDLRNTTVRNLTKEQLKEILARMESKETEPKKEEPSKEIESKKEESEHISVSRKKLIQNATELKYFEKTGIMPHTVKSVDLAKYNKLHKKRKNPGMARRKNVKTANDKKP